MQDPSTGRHLGIINRGALTRTDAVSARMPLTLAAVALKEAVGLKLQ